MKLLILSDANSPHTMRWAKSLVNRNIEIEIFSLSEIHSNFYSDYNIRVHSSGFSINKQYKNENSPSKMAYIITLNDLKKIVRKFQPDILHSHYASSYGLLGALANFHPYIISVWGSDVYSFPKRSIIHKKILSYSLSRANLVCSTSYAMASHTKRFTDTKISVVPFGIDTKLFQPVTDNSKKNLHQIVIGTIKTLEKNYGVDTLIKSFKIVREKHRQKEKN